MPKYEGPREGMQLVHSRIIIPGTLLSLEEYQKELARGFEVLKIMIPEAVRRVGCNCCYGEGPDISALVTLNTPEKAIIAFYVDFDFKIDE